MIGTCDNCVHSECACECASCQAPKPPCGCVTCELTRRALERQASRSLATPTLRERIAAVLDRYCVMRPDREQLVDDLVHATGGR